MRPTCFELQVKWQQWSMETWHVSVMLLRHGQGVMPHFIQAEAKINPSKSTEVACWKSKWQIVWMLLNFLSPSHGCTLQYGVCWSSRITSWHSEELDVVSYRSSQLPIAGSSPRNQTFKALSCIQYWKMSAAFITPHTALASAWSTVTWAGRKCSLNESIINIAPVL